MPEQNTAENIFRFVHIRPAAPDALPANALSGATPLARELSGAASRERRERAAAFLADGARVRELLASKTVRQLIDAATRIETADGSVDDLRHAAGDSASGLPALRDAASDVLLAVLFSKQVPPGYRDVERLFRAASAVLAAPVPGSLRLRQYERRALALPESLVSPAQKEAGSRATAPRLATVRPAAGAADPERLQRTVRELTALTRPEMLSLPSAAGTRSAPDRGVPFSLNERGLQRLSADARALLAELELAPEQHALDILVQALEARIPILPLHPRPLPHPAIPADAPETRPYIKDVGLADLLVVKQHLRAYERVEIAHVENVMIGEKKSRNHRALARSEDTLTVEKETITEKQTELQTAERFELNRETNLTVKRDQQFGFGLTVSGKYGPTVDFSSNLTGSASSSTEESTKSATRYAKDVVERSLERVVERVREEQVRRVIRETEETNLHELQNDSGEHVSGVYQFIEKVYESQVFNYGIRQMFDFMVPEPSSYLWYVESTKSELNLPTPPPKLEATVPTADSINSVNYLALAARYGVDGIEAPPPSYVTVAGAVAHGQDASSSGEEGQPRTVLDKEVAVPAGYKPMRAMLRPLALTDDTLTLAVALGHSRVVWRPAAGELTSVGSGHALASSTGLNLLLLTDSHPYDASSKLPLHVMAFETNTFSVAVEVVFALTQEAYRNWQIKTYDKLLNAYREALQRYEAKVAELKAQADVEASRTTIRFGAPPSQNLKTLKAELKKHCLAIVTRQRFEGFDSVQDGDPPFFGFPEAAEQGAFVRFFEQAFEWDQMQYVFYPYFWGRQVNWAERFLRADVDEEFLDFLKAGAARVVVPARPGFEEALTYFLETGEIWNGAGEPPPIHSPLYVSIISEIRERTGAPQGEIPQGDAWETRIPTPLVILRSEEHLPKWQRVSADDWEWEELQEV